MSPSLIFLRKQVISMNSYFGLFEEIQFSKLNKFIISVEKTSETAVGWSDIEPLAIFSKKFLNSSFGTIDSPLGSRAFNQMSSSWTLFSVNSSRKHFKLKNWSQTILTLSFEVSIPKDEINLLFTSLNLSAKEVVYCKKILSGIDGPSTSTPSFLFSVLPSSSSSPFTSGKSRVSSAFPDFLFSSFSFSSCSIVISDQNSASREKTYYQDKLNLCE